jgi:V/A-type H+-transporting ATPase subunit I
MTQFESKGIRKLGGVGVMCGVATMIFGVLYGEIFGLHILGEIVWGAVGLEHPPIEKGLTGATYFAQAWLLITLVIGLLHVTLGHVLSFVKELQHHGAKAAVFESGSWIVLMIGVWGWVFSILPGLAPGLFEATFDKAFHLPFLVEGLPSELGIPMLGVIAVGAVMLGIGEGVKAVEILQVLVNVLSYLRLLAVLLAKAGMAFVVNLFVFGAYEDPEGIHFKTSKLFSSWEAHGEATQTFIGLLHVEGGVTAIVAILGGLVLLVGGHLVVFALGITSAGLQSIRLEYVEFFGKFYDGGGRRFDPFGYSREYTTED